MVSAFAGVECNEERDVREEKLRNAQAAWEKANDEQQTAKARADRIPHLIKVCSTIFFESTPLTPPEYRDSPSHPGKPAGWAEASNGEFFEQDSLAPDVLRQNPPWVRESVSTSDKSCFTGFRYIISKLGIDGIWSPTKLQRKGYWDDIAGRFVRGESFCRRSCHIQLFRF